MILTRSTTVTLVLLEVLMLVLPAVALVGEVQGDRDRRERRALAIAAGLDPLEARRLYRRAPRSPLIIWVIYLYASVGWVFAMVGLSPVLDRPQLASSPSWRVALGQGEPLDLVWWMAVVFAISIVGAVHAVLNMMWPDRPPLPARRR